MQSVASTRHRTGSPKLGKTSLKPLWQKPVVEPGNVTSLRLLGFPESGSARSAVTLGLTRWAKRSVSDGLWRHGRDRDSQRRKRHREGLGQRVQPGLAGAVRGLVLLAAERP